MAAPIFPVTNDGRIVLTADQARALIDFHADTVKLLDEVTDALADLNLGYDAIVPNDATLAVGPIGRVRIRDLRRLRRRTDALRRRLGRPAAIDGITVVTLSYTND